MCKRVGLGYDGEDVVPSVFRGAETLGARGWVGRVFCCLYSSFVSCDERVGDHVELHLRRFGSRSFEYQVRRMEEEKGNPRGIEILIRVAVTLVNFNHCDYARTMSSVEPAKLAHGSIMNW